MSKILVIDNYDSFTYNLVQYLAEFGADVRVVRNDAIQLAEIERSQPDFIVLSPGPGAPNHAGICLAVIEHFKDKIPLFGVCLGMQAMALAFGGRVVRADRVMHGKTSLVHHEQQGIFQQCPNPCVVTRYHSLIVERSSLPACFEITAWADDEQQDIMAIKHQDFPIEGVQFHPESILTTVGKQLLYQFITNNTSKSS